MKHVIVTGGAGFIGSHLCEALLGRGYAVTCIDNYVTGNRENVAHLERRQEFFVEEYDVSVPLACDSLAGVREHGLFGVLHFACPASPVDFERIPFEILKVDSFGTFHALDWALRHRARFVLASTSEIYGDPLTHPQTEDYWGNVNTIGPRACYDETKRFAEACVSAAARGKGTWSGRPYPALNGGMVRIFNTYGPRMRPDDGRVVSEFCMQALRNQPITLHGDGKQTRSFCYVSDLVDGIIRYFESELREPVNLGNPNEFTMIELAEKIREHTGSKSALTHLPGREDDPRRRQPEITRARKLLDWELRVPLDEGLKRTVEYFRPFA
ncbi:MAG: GDP-mannose 4,6-dehydratase [Bdellovibrionales bacterium]|nr:GDP-mannose 4,6-dehydratase [Bdellovibrionales bacterium]